MLGVPSYQPPDSNIPVTTVEKVTNISAPIKFSFGSLQLQGDVYVVEMTNIIIITVRLFVMLNLQHLSRNVTCFKQRG